MKKLGIVVVVLAVLLLVAPFGIGKVAEKRLNASLDKLVEQAPYFKITERTWSGGWFTSTQTVTVELADNFAGALGEKVMGDILKEENVEAEDEADAETDTEPAADAESADPQAMAGSVEGPQPGSAEQLAAMNEVAAAVSAKAEELTKPLRLVIRNEVLHGPILGAAGVGLARVDTHVELSEDIRKKIAAVFGEKPAMEVSTRVSFFGGGTTTFKSEGRKLNIDDKDVDFTYDTFKMSVGLSRNADTYDIDGKLPSVVIKNASDATTFTLTDLTIDGEGERVVGELYDGDFAFNIDEVKFKAKNSAEEVLVEDAHYLVDTRTKNDYSDMAAKFGTGEVRSPDIKNLGIDIKEIHYDFSLRHLHAPTLAKIVSGMRAMYTAPLVNPEKVEDAVFGPMKEHAGELLAHDPQFGIDRVGMVTSEGEIVAKGLIKLVGATPEDFAAPGGMALIGKLDADITIEAAQKLVEKFPNGATMAGGFVDAGYAKREGDKLVCHITFKAGELLINGKPQAIPGLGGPPPAEMEPGAMEEEGAGEEVPQE